MEDYYKKKYEQAFKKAKDLHDSHALGMPFIYETCEQIFPELKESEDERIRKEIIDYLKSFIPHHDDGLVEKSKVWIAWLEKQGKLIEEYEDKFDRCVCKSFDKGYKAALEKQGEQEQTELPKGEDYGIDGLYHAARILEKTFGEVEGYQSDDGILEHKCAIEAVKRSYKQKTTDIDKAYEWLEKNIAEATGIDSYTLIESFKQAMKD